MTVHHVAQLLPQGVPVVTPDTPLTVVADALAAHEGSAVAVADAAHHPLGVVTARTLARAVAGGTPGLDPALTVSAVMAAPPPAVRPATAPLAALAAMEAAGRRQVLVVGESGRVQGAVGAPPILRAALGHLEGALSERVAAATMPEIEAGLMAPDASGEVQRACAILGAVHTLHRAGFQRLRVAAGTPPGAAHWRCLVTHAGNVRPNGWEPVDSGTDTVTYTSAQSSIGWDATGGVNDCRRLATDFVEKYPDLAMRGAGADWPYAGWFTWLLGRAESGRLPAFLEDGETDPAARPPRP